MVLETSDDASLSLLRSITDQSCQEEGTITRCVVDLPVLEARQGGTWQVVVAATAEGAAVDVAVHSVD